METVHIFEMWAT